MGAAADSTESRVSLKETVGGTGDKPESRYNWRRHRCKKRIITIGVTLGIVSLVLIAILVLAVLSTKPSSADLGPSAGPKCPADWKSYQRKCYYFSETEGNWTYGWNDCSSLGASLAGLDNRQELIFLLRHNSAHDHWIGLKREQGQPWKWTNGTIFNHFFLIEGGDCAYLNNETGISSSRCSAERRWICSKPEVHVTGTGLGT